MRGDYSRLRGDYSSLMNGGESAESLINSFVASQKPKPRIDLGTEVSFGREPAATPPLPIAADNDMLQVLIQKIADQDRKLADMQRQMAMAKVVADDRNAELLHELVEVKGVLNKLLQVPAVNGTFPPAHEIERMQVQVFHTSGLTKAQAFAGHTEWSLKVEYWHRGTRHAGIDIGLYAHRDLKAKLKACKDVPDTSIEFTDMIKANLGGMVRKPMTNGGRAYVPNQMLALVGHEDGIDNVKVKLMIDGSVIEVGDFIPAKGSKKGAALWFAKWKWGQI